MWFAVKTYARMAALRLLARERVSRLQTLTLNISRPILRGSQILKTKQPTYRHYSFVENLCS